MRRDLPTDVESLRALVRGGWPPDFLFFWGHKARAGAPAGKHCLSQWWPAPFVVEGDRYPTAEHFMMAEKASLFGDAEIRSRVLTAATPAVAKKLGREVRGFDEARWVEARTDRVVAGNHAKFSQNPDLAAYLASTGDRVLVEASPVDRIWGIGMAEKDPGAGDPTRWRGLNLLGFALMQVRAKLQQG